VVRIRAIVDANPNIRTRGARRIASNRSCRRTDVLPNHLPYDVRARPRILDDDVTWDDVFHQV
jgi:hypothetical protein